MYEEIAIARIEKAIQTQETTLNLSGLKLEALPAEIGQFTQLTKLFLGHNKLTSLPVEIGELVNLTLLDLFDNQFTDLPTEIGQLSSLTSLKLGDNQLTSLPAEIGQLANLESLDIDFNKLASLPPEIGQLENLTLLDISSNQLIKLPIEFARLNKLTLLNLGNNKIDKLHAEIEGLVNLTTLYLSNNQLTRLPSKIGQLSNLTKLYLSNNQLASLPAEIGQLTNLTKLYLNNNQLSNLPIEAQNLKALKELGVKGNALDIPPEILEKYTAPQNILKSSTGKRKAISETKMLIVGQGSVGKTSTVKRIVNGQFDDKESKTEGIAINRTQVDNQIMTAYQPSKIKLNLWDFGGQEIMHATHQFFLTKRSLYLLVLDSRLTEEENRLEYWLKIIQSFSDESPVLIVGNKIDQHPLDIDRMGLQKKYPNIVGILETSAATGMGIEVLKATITEKINNLPHIRDLLPETWFTVKTKLEGLGQETNFINQDDYVKLCVENDVTDEISQRTLIGFLHDLGVVLYFQDDRRLSDLGILNPQWVTNGVYKILNSHTLFKNKGALTVFMLDEILNLPEYPRGKRLFIVDMMKKFELCYDIEADKTFLVPDLLPKDEPTELKFNGVPAFEYSYPVLPSSVITRFIVRLNQKIDNGLVWRTGVMLKIGENIALVKADIEDRKIAIAIDGVEHTRRDALSAIRYQLDEIHASIKGLNPEKFVPVPGAPEANPLEYETLLMMEREGIETTHVKSGRKLVAVNISQMLNGVESEYQRKQYGNVININGNVTGSTIIAGDENEIKR